MPLVKPVTVHRKVVKGDSTTQVPPPGLAVTVYFVMVPLADVGAFHETVSCPFELLLAGAVTVGAVRPLGAEAPVIWLEALDAVDVPAPLVAVTEKVYVNPGVRSVMVHVVDNVEQV